MDYILVALLFSVGISATPALTSDVRSQDVDNALAAANVTIAAEYDHMSSLYNSYVINDNITEATIYIDSMVASANQTIQNLGVTMFRKIEETEALGPSYAKCTAGQREKATDIVNEGSSNLQGCQYPIAQLQFEYDSYMAEYKQLLEFTLDKTYAEIEKCVPVNEPTAEELEEILSCIDFQVRDMENSYDNLEKSLMAYVEETNGRVEVMRYEAQRCVDTASHHAGDLTGYFLYTMDQCIASVVESSSVPSSTRGA